ncbi:hypothetical protein EON66_10275, partial [archaeon]
FDYVRLRNLLDARQMEFVTASEYSADDDIARSRTRFYAGHSPVMLLTERFHFFRRYRIRGVRNLIFYAPPLHNGFYDEFLNMLEEAANKQHAVSSTLLFMPSDALPLERVVGTSRATSMLKQVEKSSYVFV